MTLRAVLAVPDSQKRSLYILLLNLLKFVDLPGLFGVPLMLQKQEARFSYVILLMDWKKV